MAPYLNENYGQIFPKHYAYVPNAALAPGRKPTPLRHNRGEMASARETQEVFTSWAMGSERRWVTTVSQPLLSNQT